MKKSHGTSYTAPQYCFWEEALEVQLQTSTDDPPRGQMFEGARTCKKPTELKDVFTKLARTLTDGIQACHRTLSMATQGSYIWKPLLWVEGVDDH